MGDTRESLDVLGHSFFDFLVSHVPKYSTLFTCARGLVKQPLRTTIGFFQLRKPIALFNTQLFLAKNCPVSVEGGSKQVTLGVVLAGNTHPFYFSVQQPCSSVES